MISSIFEFLTGIALFLFGMSLMSGSIQKAADDEAKVMLGKVTNNPLQGVLFGTAVTSIIQSSSATSVMCIGFVNGGLMNLRQAKSVILGAIFGTSITGWVLCLGEIGAGKLANILSTASITCFAAVLGTIFRMTKKEKLKIVGDVLLGFAVLMAGMSMMSDSVSSMNDNPAFLRLITDFSNPFFGILIGCIFAAVLQSASAAVGVVQALAATGMITFRIALPLIIGISVGAALPVLLAAPEASENGKKAALFYLISTLVSAVILSVVIYAILYLCGNPFDEYVMSSWKVALLNTVYRLLSVIVILPSLWLKEKNADDNRR